MSESLRLQGRPSSEIETAKALNDLARHTTITNLMADIAIDMAVCDIEGWDKTEYIKMIKAEMDRFATQFPT